MKRDMSLVREILLTSESLPADADHQIPLTVGKSPLVIPGYTSEQIAYYWRLIALLAYQSQAGQKRMATYLKTWFRDGHLRPIA